MQHLARSIKSQTMSEPDLATINIIKRIATSEASIAILSAIIGSIAGSIATQKWNKRNKRFKKINKKIKKLTKDVRNAEMNIARIEGPLRSQDTPQNMIKQLTQDEFRQKSQDESLHKATKDSFDRQEADNARLDDKRNQG